VIIGVKYKKTSSVFSVCSHLVEFSFTSKVKLQNNEVVFLTYQKFWTSKNLPGTRKQQITEGIMNQGTWTKQ
jgi:hypothetical protein